MSKVKTFTTLLNTDPESFTDVPSNEEIINSNSDLKRWGQKDLSHEVRQGFLEMWSFTHARELISRMEKAELQSLHQEAREELNSPDLLAASFDDLRFIVSTAGQEIAARQYQVE